MNLVCVHPGAEWSVTDIWRGIRAGLAQYDDVHQYDYNLGVRLERSDRWLKQQYKIAKKDEPKIVKPTYADVCRHASEGCISRSLWIESDWVLIISAIYFHPDVALMLRRAGKKIATVLTESPYEDQGQMLIAALSNVVFTNERTSVAALEEAFKPYEEPVGGRRIVYLPPAYDVEKHTPDAPIMANTKALDCVFVGTPWPERVKLWKAVNWQGIKFGAYGTMDGNDMALQSHYLGGITTPEQTVSLYRAAKVGLNFHRQHETAESMNIRCYELAASGCCFVSDERKELTEILGDAVPIFRNAEELEGLLRKLLAMPDLRDSLKAKARARVAEHTWRRRAEIVYSALGGGSQ